MLVEIIEPAPRPIPTGPKVSSAAANRPVIPKGLEKASEASMQSLAAKLNQMSISGGGGSSSLDRAVLLEIYDQLRRMKCEMGRISEAVKEERRARKCLQEALYSKT